MKTVWTLKTRCHVHKKMEKLNRDGYITMSLEVLAQSWPYLLVLFYLLTMAIVRVLHGHFRSQTALHNLLRDSKMRRNEYLKALDQRIEAHQA